MSRLSSLSRRALLLLALALPAAQVFAQPKEVTLLNVSYDPTRELYQEYNKLFADYWLKKTGQTVIVKQSLAPMFFLQLKFCIFNYLLRDNQIFP